MKNPLGKLGTFYFSFRCSSKSLSRLWVRERLFRKTRDRLSAFHGAWSGKTIFVVGNGPSLTEQQISFVSNHCFIATNRAYQLFPDASFMNGGNGFLVINDFSRAQEVLPTLPEAYQQVVYGCPDPENILASQQLLRNGFLFARCHWGVRLNQWDVYLTDNDKCQAFSHDFKAGYYPGHSVAFSAIQLAAYLGAKRIVLIGCDMNYSGPTQYSSLIKPGRHRLGHVGFFDYDYHGRPHMLACIEGLAQHGIELLNATVGGAITDLKRVSQEDLEELLLQDLHHGERH
jgi:hypothetical protein